MPQREFIQLAYVSTYNSGRMDSPLQALRAIVSASKRNNARNDITGYLVFDGQGFLQILEGEPDQVAATYETIERDPRHRDARTIGRRAVSTRQFADWAMAGYLRRPEDCMIFERHAATGALTDVFLSLEQAVALASELVALPREQTG